MSTDQEIVFEDLDGNPEDATLEAAEWQAPDDTGADLSEELEAAPEPEVEAQEPEVQEPEEPEPEAQAQPAPPPPAPMPDLDLRRAIQEEREHRIALETQLQQLMEKDEQRETTAQKAKLAVDMQGAREQLRSAIEAADIDAQVKAQMNVSELAGRMQVLDITPPTPKPPPLPRAQANPTQPAQPPTLAPKAQAYQSRNVWIGDSRYPQANEALHMIDRALSAEGHSPNDDSYFAELSKRLSAVNSRNPLGVNIEPPAKPKPNPKAPRPGVDRGEAGVAPGKARRALTAVDKRDMLQFNMDPKNQDHVKHFLRERIARERQEATQARGVR